MLKQIDVASEVVISDLEKINLQIFDTQNLFI